VYSQHLSPEDQRLHRESSDSLTRKPSRVGDPVFIASNSGKPERLTAYGDTADLAFTDRKPVKASLDTAVVGLFVMRHAGARGKVEGLDVGLVFDFPAQGTGSVGDRKPDACQHGVGALSNAVSDGAQYFLERSLTSGGDHDLRQLVGIHGIQTTILRYKAQRRIVYYE